MGFLKQIVVKWAGQITLVITLILAVLFGIKYFQEHAKFNKLHQELVGTQDKYQQLSKYVAKLETDYQNQKDLVAEAQKEWKGIHGIDEGSIEASIIQSYGLDGNTETQKGPDFTYKTPTKTDGFTVDELRLNGPDSPPVGYILIKSDGETVKHTYKFKIEVDNLQTVDSKTGKVEIYSKAYFIPQEDSFKGLANANKNWNGILYPLDVAGGVAYVDPTIAMHRSEKRFQLWAPRIVGGFDFGSGKETPFARWSLGYSFMGYGASQRDLDWRFAQIGFDSDAKFSSGGPVLVPAAYRPFPKILTNTYFGPGIGYDAQGTNFFLNLSLGF